MVIERNDWLSSSSLRRGSNGNRSFSIEATCSQRRAVEVGGGLETGFIGGQVTLGCQLIVDHGIIIAGFSPFSRAGRHTVAGVGVHELAGCG